MTLYYFPFGGNQIVKIGTEVEYACLCMCTYFTTALFTGLIPVYNDVCNMR